MANVLWTSDAPGTELRTHLGLASSEPLRISYLPGPGDVFGTFQHWSRGEHDPRVPIVAYSLMFFELAKRLNAAAQTVSIHPIANLVPRSDDQYRFDYVAPPTFTDRWSYYASQRKFAQDLVTIVNDHDPHIVVASTHMPPSSWPRLARNRALVLSAHNSFWPMGHQQCGAKQRLQRMLLRHQAKSIDAAVCTSHECARQLSELSEGRIEGETECPQVLRTYPVRNRLEAKNLLFLGRIEVSKGVVFLIDAFDKMAGKHVDLRLVIAGDGSAAGLLAARIGASRYRDRIDYRGHVDSDGVHAALAAADLVICPTMTSFHEGLAVVGFEAAAHGVPTLLSSVVPAAELLGDSCTVYPADDAVAFQTALSRLIADPEYYRTRCAATSRVRELIYDRSLSWGSALFRALMKI